MMKRNNWEYLSLRHKFTIEFIEEFKDKIEWLQLSHNPHLTYEIYDKYKDKLSVESYRIKELLYIQEVKVMLESKNISDVNIQMIAEYL